jgi:hypothetical protein
VHLSGRRPVPELRWTGLAMTSRPIVAAIESRTVPAPDWCERLLDAHRRAPGAPAVGGPVALKDAASLADWGLYFAEYARFAPPVTEGDAQEISGANLSYKRSALDTSRDLLEAGVWEVFIHERWIRQGLRLRLAAAPVTFQNGLTTREAVSLRYRYGRTYAADRCATLSGSRRLLFAGGAPLLPFVLTGRLVSTASQKGLLAAFVRALPWTFLFNAAWSCGEMVGYVRGR